MTVGDLKAWLQVSWSSVKAALLAGSYLPREVRAVDIDLAKFFDRVNHDLLMAREWQDEWGTPGCLDSSDASCKPA